MDIHLIRTRGQMCLLMSKSYIEWDWTACPNKRYSIVGLCNCNQNKKSHVQFVASSTPCRMLPYHENTPPTSYQIQYIPWCFVDVFRPNQVVHSYGVIPHQSFVPYNDWNLVHPEILVALKPHVLSPPLIFFGSPGVPMFTALEDVVVQPGDPSFDIAAGQFTVGKPKAAPKSPEERPRYTGRQGISNCLVLWGWYQKPLYLRIPSKLYNGKRFCFRGSPDATSWPKAIDINLGSLTNGYPEWRQSFKESKAHHLLVSMSNSDCVIDPHVFLQRFFFDMFFMEAVLRGLVCVSCLVWWESGESEGAQPVNMELCHFRLERNRVGMYRIHRQGHGINMNSNGDVSVGWFLHILTIWVNPCEGFMARFFDGTIIIPLWFCYSNLTFVLLTKVSTNPMF